MKKKLNRWTPTYICNGRGRTKNLKNFDIWTIWSFMTINGCLLVKFWNVHFTLNRDVDRNHVISVQSKILWPPTHMKFLRGAKDADQNYEYFEF